MAAEELDCEEQKGTTNSVAGRAIRHRARVEVCEIKSHSEPLLVYSCKV